MVRSRKPSTSEESRNRVELDRHSFAFIDAQNIHLGMRALGWELDWRLLRSHLRRRYGVTTAYLFAGYLPRNSTLYRSLADAGYTLVFKQVAVSRDGRIKGNVDADLVLQAMIDIDDYFDAVIVTSNGDFACLVRYLRERNKLRAVISPSRERCSNLLRRSAGGSIDYLHNLRRLLEYPKRQKAP